MAIGGKQFLMDKEHFPPCLKIDIFVGSPDSKLKEQYKLEGMLIDTGSDLTIIPNSFIKKLKLKMTGIKDVENFNGESIEVKFYSCKIIIDDIFEGIFEVGGIDSDALLGMDLIKDWHILMNGPGGIFEIANKTNYKISVHHS